MRELPSERVGVVSGWSRVLRRRALPGIAITVLITGLSAALVLTATPIWRAESSLRLGAAASMGGVPLGAGAPTGLFSLFQQMTGDPFANEQELLSSRTVAEGVVLDHALHVQLRSERGWTRDSLVEQLAAGQDARPAVYTVEWQGNDRVRVRRTEPTPSNATEHAVGAPVTLGGVVVRFRAWRPGMPREAELRVRRFGDAVRRASSAIRVERTRRDANLASIRYEAPDPRLARDVVASAINRYRALRAELAKRESGQTVDSLGNVVRRTFAELTAAEQELERFEREHGLVAPDAQSRALVEQLSEVAANLARARLELAGVEDVERRLAAVADPGEAWPGLAAHPTFLANETLGGMLTSLVELQQQRIELASRRTENNRSLQALDQQIAYLDNSLRSLVRDYRSAVAQQAARLQARSDEFDVRLAGAPAAAIELGRHQRRVRQLSEVYLFADQRRRQEALRNALSFASVQVVDAPAVLSKPVWPRQKLGLGVGLLLGIGAGLLAMLVAERADRSVRLGSELTALLGAPLVGALVARRGAQPQLGEGARDSILRRVADCGAVHTVLVTPVGTDAADAEAVAAALRDRGPGDVAASRAALPAPLQLAPGSFPVRSAAALEVASREQDGAVVLLVARQGATRSDQASRAGRMLRLSEARVCGVVLLCGDSRQLEDAWA